MNFPRIEDFATRGSRETIDEYGARALRFILEYKVAGLLDDEAVQQADRISVIAVSARDVSQAALRNLSEARTIILLSLDARRSKRTAVLAALASGDGLRPQGGAKVPAGPVAPTTPPNDGDAVQVPDAPDAAPFVRMNGKELRELVSRPTMADVISKARAARGDDAGNDLF